MAESVAAVIDARAREPEGLSRMIAWSIAGHVVVLGALLVMPTPSIYEEPRVVMSISLGGSAGPVTGGETQMGGRAIEEPPPDTPPPPRPVETPPPPPPAPAMTTPPPETAPRRPQQQQPQQRRAATPPQPQPRRAPFANEQPRQGSTRADTGAQGVGRGLSTAGGGGGSGVQLDVADFCCQEYLEEMVARIQRNWANDQGAVGTTTMRFTIQRDGRIENIRLARTSTHVALDLAAERALYLTNELNRLPPLPNEFPNPTLTVHLRFEYER